MTYTYHIVDTRTGVKQLQVFPVSGSWARVLNNAGPGGSHTFQLGGPGVLSRLQWQNLSRQWARTIVVSWNGAAKYAGVITDNPFDDDSLQLTLGHVDIRSLLGLNRYVFGGGQYRPGIQSGPPPGDLILNNMELYSIAANVAYVGMQGPFDVYSLPIVLPATVPGAFSKSWHNENFTTVESALQEIQSTEGGPDIDFAPRWNALGNLEWVMRVGSPSVPMLGGNSLEWNMTVANPGIFKASRGSDAQKQWTGVFGVGNGSGKDMLVEGFGAGSLGDVSLPARDTIVQFKSIEDSVALQAQAKGELLAMRTPTKERAFSMLADGAPGFDLVQLGSPVSLYYKDHPWYDDGWERNRVTGYSGDMSNTINIKTQPVGS